jgi:lipopolysaccharide export system ATP-binding protein
MVSKSLIIDSVFFRYKTNEILRGVYIKLKLGCVCGLYGLNGSGKTTLLKIVAGILKPASGTVFIGDKVLNCSRIHERYLQIAYLSQQGFLPDDLRVKDLIKQFPETSKQLLGDELISKLLEQKIYSLSSGERRYIEVNLILSLQRQFTLLDEPFTGLEPINIERIIKVIMETKKDGRAVLLTDHYQQYVKLAIDEAYLLNEGQCIATSTINYRNLTTRSS